MTYIPKINDLVKISDQFDNTHVGYLKSLPNDKHVDLAIGGIGFNPDVTFDVSETLSETSFISKNKTYVISLFDLEEIHE